MRHFANLYTELDATTSTNAKVAAMASYFKSASPADAAWALYFLTGRRLKRFISSRFIREWTMQAVGIEEWLFQESYNSVGDTAEVCALILDSFPRPVVSREEMELTVGDESLAVWMEDRILPLLKIDEAEQKSRVTSWWAVLPHQEVFILNKLLTGAFRVGVSQSLVARSVAEVSGQSVSEISHRLMGNWEPTPEAYERLIHQGESTRSVSQPYPFFLASPLEKTIDTLGLPGEWQAEWKWDGIRAQLIRRGNEIFIWSRGEELITDRFPEIKQAALTLPPGTVLDGEILAMQGEKVLPFATLQKRIGRKTVSQAILKEAPAGLMIYDCLEFDSEDLREKPLSERRRIAEALTEKSSAVLHLSPLVEFNSWNELAEKRNESRDRCVEGLMLKRPASDYQSGRKRGDWWKWKVDPLTIDAVLIYAQAGSGRRANLFTDYTFAVWDGPNLVPVAKAYSGLSDEEINRLDSWIRRNTRDRFGPVRSVAPEHVFELAFEGINLPTRHKSGVAVRFPRILRWRHDKKIEDADSLATLKELGNHATADSTQLDLERDTTTEKA